MELNGAQSGPERSKQTYEQRQNALIDANRALVRAAREDLTAVARRRLAEARALTRQPPAQEVAAEPQGSRRDAIELSEAARAASQPSTAEREARVRELAEAHRMERLHTPERIERAAQRLLEG